MGRRGRVIRVGGGGIERECRCIKLVGCGWSGGDVRGRRGCVPGRGVSEERCGIWW